MTSIRSGCIGIAVGLVASAALRSLSAQQLPEVRPGQRVRVTAPSAGLHQAVSTVEALSASELTLLRERLHERGWVDTLHVRVALDSVRRVEVSTGQHSHEWTGAGVGAVVGGTVGYMIGQRRKCSCCGPCYSAEGGALLGGVVGAVVGGLIGDGIRTDEWLPVDLHRLRIGLLPQSGGRLGLGASLGF